jgi:hypothetical protein
VRGEATKSCFCRGSRVETQARGDSSDVVESDDSVRPGVLVLFSLMAKVWLVDIIEKLFPMCRYL